MPANPFSQGLSVKVGGDASGATSALGALKKSILSTKTVALGLGGVLAGALAAKGLGSAISAAGDFNSAMTESLAIMGDVSDAMRSDMQEAAREVGRTTTFSATEAAESYFFLASAGLDAKESVEALDDVGRFAQAGMFDMATATDLLTDSASALGFEVDEYNKLADVLVKANQNANASVEQFASSLTRQAATSMRSNNIAVEEGVAVLSAWADQGIKGERAGTLFRRTIDQLQESALDNQKAFEKFGIEVFDADGNLRNMADITRDMEAAFDGMSQETQAAALKQLGFSVRTREGILALLGNSEALREYQTSLENAGGATEEVADKQLQSFNSKMKIFKDRINDAKIEIGNKLLPVVSDLLDEFMKEDGLIDALSEFLTDILTEDNIQKVVDFGKDLSTLIDPIKDVASETIDMLVNLAILFGVMDSDAANNATNDIQVLANALEDLADFLEDVNDAFERLNEIREKAAGPSDRELINDVIRNASPAERSLATGGASFDATLLPGVDRDDPLLRNRNGGGQNSTVVVTVEGDTDVVRNVSAEVVDDRMMVDGRRVFRTTGTR